MLFSGKPIKKVLQLMDVMGEVNWYIWLLRMVVIDDLSVYR